MPAGGPGAAPSMVLSVGSWHGLSWYGERVLGNGGLCQELLATLPAAMAVLSPGSQAAAPTAGNGMGRQKAAPDACIGEKGADWRAPTPTAKRPGSQHTRVHELTMSSGDDSQAPALLLFPPAGEDSGVLAGPAAKGVLSHAAQGTRRLSPRRPGSALTSVPQEGSEVRQAVVPLQQGAEHGLAPLTHQAAPREGCFDVQEGLELVGELPHGFAHAARHWRHILFA